jgi:MarR-like DNA-binding transcriptional regulator SgrR of sgrS sRNA
VRSPTKIVYNERKGVSCVHLLSEAETKKKKKKILESETRAADNVQQERDQLIFDLFEALNEMYLPALGESLEAMTSRLIDLKRKITTLDPNWIFVDSSNYYVFRILFCISRLDIQDCADFRTNQE